MISIEKRRQRNLCEEGLVREIAGQEMRRVG